MRARGTVREHDVAHKYEQVFILYMKNTLKEQGFVRTPPFIAEMLAHWALRHATDQVLDAGFGEGVFLLASAKRLLALGTSRPQLTTQLYGVDSHPEAVNVLQRTLCAHDLHMPLPGVRSGDFFASVFPQVDVLIGNPPYVRRWWQKDVETLHSLTDQVSEMGTWSRLTDLACYFVVYGARFLKPGGRLALIVSDSWLDTRYGVAFKAYLLRTFQVRGMLGFQSQVFPDVLVRPVMILAEKRHGVGPTRRERVAFVSLNGRLPKTIPLAPGHLLKQTALHVSGTVMRADTLQPQHNWTPLLYAPRAHGTLAHHPAMTSLASLAQARLGLQSFAKMFYIVPRETQERWTLESRWLVPFVMSPKDITTPAVHPETPIRHYLIACDVSKAALAGTQLMNYIQYWEKQVLTPRGLARPVVGVHNLPRLGKTRRAPWYNLCAELTRRGTASILLPRRIYQRYHVIWNQAGWVAGENFIELLPRASIPLAPLLAVLNASTTELAVRTSAHVYGGGIYNLSPGTIGAVPVVDVRRLAPAALQALEEAYHHFVRSGGTERAALDRAVLQAAEIPLTFLRVLQDALIHMSEISSAILEPTAIATTEEREWPEELRLS